MRFTPAQHRVLLAKADMTSLFWRASQITPPRRPIRKKRVCLCGHTRPASERD